MTLPDMRTLIFSFVITDLIITIVMVMLWIQNRKHFSGTIFWVCNFAFQTIALILIALRGTIPDLISMALSNTLVISGNILALIGLERFAEVKGRHTHNYILLAIFIFIHTWFTIVKPDLPVRNLNIAIAFFIISLQVTWFVAFRLKGDIRKLTRSIGIIFLLYCIVNLARIVNYFTAGHPGNDYFQPNLFESSVLILYQALFIILTYSLVLMFNKRLLNNIEEKNETLKESQAILKAAMDCSPSGIAIADAPSGKLRYVNKAGLMIPAKSEEEIVKDIDINKYVESWNIKHHDGTPFKPDEVPLARAVLFGETNIREFIISRDVDDDRIVLANAAPIIDETGKIKAGVVVFQDLTEYKRAQENLRETGEYLENLINYANAPIIVWDTNLRITRFNHAFENLTGLKAPEVINRKIDILFPAESREESLKNIRNTTMGTRWEVVEIPIANIDGTVRTVIWNSATIYDKDGLTPVAEIAQGQDITERKQAEKQLTDKISELEKFNKIMVGREIRMIELKQEINELCKKLKLPCRYESPEEVNRSNRK